MKTPILLCFLLSFSSLLLANTTTQDSLLSQLTTVEDSAQIPILEELAQLPTLTKAQQIAYLNQAIAVAERTHHPVAKANNLVSLGRIYVSTEDYEQALVVSQKALTLFEENNKPQESTMALTLIGTIYVYLENLDIAILQFKKALAIRLKLGNQLQISKALMNVGNVLAMKGDMDEAMDYYQQTLQIKEKLDDKTELSQLYNNIANIHFAKEEMDKALPYRLKALEMDRLTGDQYQIALKTYNLAEYFLNTNAPQKALPYINESKAIAEQLEISGLVNDNIQFLSLYYELTNKPAKALEFQKLYAQSIKGTFSKELSERVGEMQVKYETEKHEKESQAIKLELEEARNEKVILSFLLIIGGLITCFSIFLYLKKKKMATNLEKEVLKRTDELRSKNEELERNSIELVKAKEKAIESNRLKSAFLTNMSHEIRTPMNGILGFTDLLINENLENTDKERYAAIVKKSSDRMLSTIENIIEASQIETDQVEIIQTAFSLNELTNSIYKRFNSLNKENKINLTLKNGLEDNESIIYSSKSKLNVILTHLLNNAFKFTPKGSIDFGYNLKGNVLEFYINDTGIGVPQERQSAIFDLFVQSDIEDKNAYEGNGLGLYLAKSFVELLGGKIELQSETEKGSSFRFTLPYKQNPNEIFRVIHEAKKIGTKNLPEEIKVLIVEDDFNSDLYLTTIIKEITTNIIHAENGLEAIETCHKHPDIDLILMDIKMPIINGIEAIKRIRQFNHNVHIIAQTAYALSGDREKAIAAGCDDYISKPIKKDELEHKIKNYDILSPFTDSEIDRD